MKKLSSNLFDIKNGNVTYAEGSNSMNSIIDRQLEYYQNRDAAGMAQFFHKEIELFSLKDNKRTHTGLTEIVKMYSRFFEKSPNLNFELLDRKSFGSYIIDHERIIGFLNQSDPVETIAIYQIEENLIRRVWIGF